jgi:hypothetical protein
MSSALAGGGRKQPSETVMTLLALTLSGIAIAAGASAMVWQRDSAPQQPVVPAQAAQPAFHPPAIDLGRLAQACGGLG